MDVNTALEWASTLHHAVLITLRRDGRAQSSDVIYAVVAGQIRVSVTADRAKTANMRRDPRVVVHLTEPGRYSYVSLDATVELSPAAAETGDAVVDELVDLYRKITGGDHADWAEYRSAMVAEQRCVARITPHTAVGQING